MTATIEPDGKKCAIDVRGVVEAPSAIPLHMAKLAGQPAPGGHSPPAGSKMKLKCSPQVIKFASVEMNSRRWVDASNIVKLN